MFTASDAKLIRQDDIDDRIRRAVEKNQVGHNGATMRVYCEDPWCNTIRDELEKRGFKNINAPEIIIKGDVYFEWDL